MRNPPGIERLYVDFDSFFATAEQHLRPDLRGRPVGVIPVDSEHTGLIAASREAKRLGISGAPGCARRGGPAPASCSCPPATTPTCGCTARS